MIGKLRTWTTSETAIQRATWLLLAALLVLYGGWIAYGIVADRPLDFYVYLITAKIYALGGDPYTITPAEWDATAAEMGITNYTWPYRYPPHTALLLTPLLSVSPKVAALLWVSANALAMIAGAWFLAGLFTQPYSRPLSLLLLLLLVPPLATLLAGQVVGLLYLSTALGLLWLVRQRYLLAGWMLALGVTLKVVPLAMVAYLFWRKQWKVAFYAIGMLLLLLWLAIPLTGLEGMLSYFRHSVALGEPGVVNSAPPNQTITAFIGRSLPHIATDQTLLLARTLSLAVVVVTVVVCAPRGNFQTFVSREYALIVAALPMVAPYTWYHQLVMLHVPLLVAVMTMIAKRETWLLMVTLLLVALTDVHGLFWHQTMDALGNGWWLSFPLLLTGFLWTYLVVDITRSKFVATQSRAELSISAH